MTHPDHSTDSDAQRLLAVEDAYVRAEVVKDEATLRRILDDRFVFNSAAGTTASKDDLVRTVLEGSMASQEISERTVVIDGDAGVIFGTTELGMSEPDGRETISRLRYTAVYVRRDGSWRMLALHMSPRRGT